MSCITSCERYEDGSCKACESFCQSSCEDECQSRCEESCQETCENSCQSSVQKNRAPSIPSSFSIPSEVRSKTTLSLSWGSSSDSDGNLRGYELERSVNNGSYSQIYKDARRSYNDTIIYGWNTVSYRVRAYDSYNKHSSYRYSNTATILNNAAPTISGANTDLGSKLTDFTIPYTITDEQNDKVTVDIFLNGTKVVTAKTVTLLVENTYLVNLGDLGLGNHEVRIVATDSKGESSAPRVYTFTKANTAPVISGTNRHIGGRSVAFTESFRVTDKDGDNITVKISLNGTEFSTITSAQDQDLTFTITDALIRPLTVDSENVIVITATDPNGGVANRRLTFTKTNNPPKIGSTDRSLGNKKEPFSFTYSATDMEGDQLYYRLYLNNRLLKEDLEMVDGKTYSYTLSHMDFIQLPYGNHQIKIEVWDDRTVNNKQYRYYDFTRVSNGLELEIKISEESVMPIKIIAVPNGIIASDAVKSIHVCNNYLDSNPTWELATGTVEQAGGYRFTNAKKTSDKWCVGLRLVIENGASGAVSTIDGMKGWFE